MFGKTLILCAALAVAAALPASDKNGVENGQVDCTKKDSLTCFKLRILEVVDGLESRSGDDDKNTETVLVNGISIVKTKDDTETLLARPRSIDSGDVDSLLLDRFTRFLGSRSLKVDIKGTEILDTLKAVGRSFDGSDDDTEARGKKKKAAKIIGPIMMAVALKAAALLPLALGFIALIAGKALLVGKIALVISTIIGLKKLLGGQQKHVTYEVVSHPHHSSSHVVTHDEHASGGGDFGGYSSGGASSSGGHGSGGWARSLPSAQEMAYAKQKPE